MWHSSSAADLPGGDDSWLGSDEATMLWRSSLEPLVIVDDECRYIKINPAAASLLRAPAPQVLKRRVDDFTPRERRAALADLWRDFETHGRLHGEYELLRGDGSRVTVEFNATREFRPGEHLIAARETAPRWARLRSAAVHERQVPRLTPREREVLEFAADGKLGAANRASAVAVALRLGVIE